MKSKGRSQLLILAVLVPLTCAIIFGIVFSPAPANAAILSGLSTPAPTATPTAYPGTGTSCKVTYTNVAQFSGGFLVTFVIANTGSTAINGWVLKFAFPNGQVITSYFNAATTQVGANVTLTSRAYNGTIAPGGTLIAPPGFVATWNNITNSPPASFTLNGTVCSKG